MSEPSVLAYWNVRGLTERIRIMLEYCGVKFVDKRYQFGDNATELKSEAWGADKPNLGMDFPNLPYYIDGDVRLSESMAIMKYIARKHNMVPESVEGWAKVEMMEGVVNDYFHAFAVMCYSQHHEALKVEFFKNSPTTLAKFDSHLSKNEWLGGDKLTYIDFCFGEILDHVRLFYKDHDNQDCFADFKNVKNFLQKYDNLESVIAHRKAEGYRAMICHAPFAKWGG